MSNADVVAMIGNVSRSLSPVQTLISGLGYLIGILFVITAIMKLKKIGESKTGSSSQEHMFVPIAYLLGGVAMIFIRSTIEALSSSTFGVGNILQYMPYNPYNVYNSMQIVIQTAGLLWFIRGCVLLVHGSEPGVQEGPKGLTFIVAGILAMNFEGTYGALDYIVNSMLDLTTSAHSGMK